MMAAAEDKELSGSNALAAVWQRKGLIGGIVVGAVVLAIGALQLVTPAYTASALVALNPKIPSLASSRGSATPALPVDQAQVKTEINVLQSRALAADVVTELKLRDDPEFAGGRLKALFAWAAEQWAGEGGELPSWAPQKQEKPDSGIDPVEAKVVDELQDRLTVKADTESHAIQVSFRSEDPVKAAKVANAFAELYIQGQLKRRFEEIEQATGWVSDQIAALRGDVKKASESVADYRTANGLTTLDSDPAALAAQQLVALNTELALMESQRAEAESKLRQVQGIIRKGGDLRALDMVAGSTFIQTLRQQEAELLGKVAQLSSKYRDDHPMVTTARAELVGVRGEINGEIGKLVQTLQNRVDQTRGQEADLRGRMEQISTQAGLNNRSLAELQQKARELETKNLMLESFETRYRELTNRTEIERPDARIVSHAVAPAKPSHPKSLLFVGISFAASLGLGILLALLLERSRPGFRSTLQIRHHLGLPTLGVVPEVTALPKRLGMSDYVLEKPTSVYAEAIKSAQLAILNSKPDASTKRILVTSSMPREGKSAFSTNLARTLAQNGYRTLLIDCDLRRPAVAKLLRAPVQPGIIDVLRGNVSLAEAVRTDEKSGLQYLVAGPATDEPQRLLRQLIEDERITEFTGGYDVVIYDSPPTMVASDSAALAKGCDFALYVVEWDRTPRRAVQAGVEYLQSVGVRVAGVVLSKVDLDRQKQDADYVDFCFRYGEYYAK